MSDFTTRLKKLRKEKNLFQSEVAEEIGIASSSYSNYEQGTRSPDNETLIKLAKFFEVSIDYLLGETDEKQTANKVISIISEDQEFLDFYHVFRKNEDIKRIIDHSKNLSDKSIKQILKIIKIFEESDKS